LISCGGDSSKKLRVNLSNVEIDDVKISRYGKDLFAVDPDNIKNELEALSGKYYFFLGGNLDDTLNLIQIQSYITDPGLLEISSACFEKYPDLDVLEDDITSAFKHFKYYFPDTKIPKVYSYISGLDFEYPVRVIDTVMIIALDMYLGKGVEFYKQIGLPEYKTNFLDEEYIIIECMKELGTEKIPFDVSNKNLLELMICNGKLLYFSDAMLPVVTDDIKIKFTPDQLDWCKENESNIWSLFIDQQLLYTKDLSVIHKFLNDGPFTAGLSKESPSRLGQWIGWQIVRSYMNNNDVSLQQLINEKDAQHILSESSYKPAR